MLINISNLFINKQISDKATILTCFIYFLNCLQLYLIRAKDVENIKGTKSFFVKNVCIGGISIRAIFK